MKDFVRCIFTEKDGELAAVGTFTPRFVDKLDKRIEFGAPQMLKVKKLLGMICQGARLVMRTYTRVCCDKNRSKDDKKNRELRGHRS